MAHGPTVRRRQPETPVDNSSDFNRSNFSNKDNIVYSVYSSTNLISREEVHPWLQFNPYVSHGYRHKNITIFGCCCSMCYCHNETMNVYTHLIPGLFFLIQLLNVIIYYSTTTPSITTPMFSPIWFYFGYEELEAVAFAPMEVDPINWFLHIGCIIGFLFIFWGSVVYHAFMSACTTQLQYDRLLKADVLTSTIGCTLTAGTFILRGHPCMSHVVIYICFFIFLFSFIITTQTILFSSHDVKGRMKIVGCHTLLRSLLVIPAAITNSIYGISRVWLPSTIDHSLAFFILFIGALFNVSRFPERLYPLRGTFLGNNLLNSHVIWHVLSTISAFLTYIGNLRDLKYWSDTPLDSCF